MSSFKDSFKNAPLTFILGISNILVFLALSFIGVVEDANFMLNHGAMYVPLVWENHEYYRLFTSMFLHFGINHIVNNMLSLFVFGISLEKEIGTFKFGIIYFVSGLLANVASGYYDIMTESFSVSAGASGAIFGIIGALLYVAIRNHGRIGGISGRGIIIMTLFTLYYGFTSTGVDNMAHIAGFIFGFILSVILYHKRRNIRNERR